MEISVSFIALWVDGSLKTRRMYVRRTPVLNSLKDYIFPLLEDKEKLNDTESFNNAASALLDPPIKAGRSIGHCRVTEYY
jgi:hypothetical protein